jgi:translation initiation factor IF-1
MKTFLGTMIIAGACTVGFGGSAFADQQGPGKEQTHLKGHRVVVGTVQEVRANELKVMTDEIQPRFVPIKPGTEKGLSQFKPGDKIEITLNDQNLIVDYHRAGADAHHHVVKGRIAENLVVGHDKALIETDAGKKEYEIQSPARSKMAAVPPGVEAEFLIDEANKIADVNFLDKGAAQDRAPMPIKGAHRRIEGYLVSKLEQDRIRIRTEDGKESAYEIRPLIKEKFSKLAKGDAVVLMLDTEDKVIDVAFTPKG